MKKLTRERVVSIICRRLADATDDVVLREQFLSLHQGFLEYARHLDTRERIVSAPGG
jgi:hypothetical protein